jgi:MinD-like ATPase involved in chromosome partitioning or flagellar assembly
MGAGAETPVRAVGRIVPDLDPTRIARAPDAPRRLGPLLAVCGLVGGAGVTTLAYLVALAAARQWREPVLVADTGGPSGGLAACAGVEVPRSLAELAEQLAAGALLGGGLYATGQGGVRVLASGPELFSTTAHEQVSTLLLDAREAHGLTVVDCGTMAREVEQTAASTSSHAAWVLPATAHGIRAGGRVLDAAPRPAGQELIVARRDARQPAAQLRELRRIAAERQAPLVLMPHLPGLEAGRLEDSAEAAQVPVQAILGALKR